MKHPIRVMLIIAFLTGAITCTLLTAQAEIPRLINYQGKLTDNDGKALDGSYSITFKIYDRENAVVSLWEETQNVVVERGVFSVLLGSTIDLNIPFDKPYFLEFQVEDEVMNPRQRIASVGYAITAKNGVPRGGIIMWSGAISDIPSGWALCDGNNGTPNLTDRFVIHADADVGGVRNVGSRGGEHTHALSIDEMPEHKHAMYIGSGAINQHHFSSSYGGTEFVASPPQISWAGGSRPHNNMPKYYALAYIMKL